MLSLRSFLVAAVAGTLLLAGPARATRTSPAGPPSKADRPTTPARRSAAARPSATAPTGKKGARRATASATAAVVQPAEAVPVAVVPAAPAEPQTMALTGLVLSPKGRPCPGVCVFPTADPHQMAVTDAQGSFRLQVPAHATVSLQADYAGLGSSRIALDRHTPQPVHIVLGR